MPYVSRFLRDVGNQPRSENAQNRIWQRRFYDYNVLTDRNVSRNYATCTAIR